MALLLRVAADACDQHDERDPEAGPAPSHVGKDDSAGFLALPPPPAVAGGIVAKPWELLDRVIWWRTGLITDNRAGVEASSPVAPRL